MLEREGNPFLLKSQLFEFNHFYAKLVKNKRRSRNRKGELVLKTHFEHPSIDALMVKKTFETKVVPWCKKNGVKLVILDNDSKFHSKMLVECMKRHGIQIYPGSGSKVWVIFYFFFIIGA